MSLVANQINIAVLDEDGSPGSIELKIPTSVTEAAGIVFSDSFATLCQAVMIGGVQSASITLSVDIAGLGLATVATALANTAKKFFSVWTSTIGKVAKQLLPTIDETLLLADGSPDPASTPMNDFLAANLNGLTMTSTNVVQPCDSVDNDIITTTRASELFAKKKQ